MTPAKRSRWGQRYAGKYPSWWAAGAPKAAECRQLRLLRFDQTDGKIVAYGMKPEWGYARLLAKPFQHQLHRGLSHGVWGRVTGLMNTKPILPVTGLCSSNMACSLPERGYKTALHLLSVLGSARGGAHSAVHTFGRTVGNFDQVNGGHCQ